MRWEKEENSLLLKQDLSVLFWSMRWEKEENSLLLKQDLSVLFWSMRWENCHLNHKHKCQTTLRDDIDKRTT